MQDLEENPIYKKTLESDNPRNEIPKLIGELLSNKYKLFRSLAQPARADEEAADKVVRAKLEFFKDMLHMQLLASLYP